MIARQAIEALLAAASSAPAFAGEGDHPEDGGGASSARHREARVAWATQTCAAWREAHRQMDERLGEAADRVSEEEFERLCDEEEAKVAAIRAEIDDVIERDLWPRELYWGGV